MAMKAPSMSLLRTFSPVWRQDALPWTARGCLGQQKADFSSTRPTMARKNKGEKTDMRITVIRYHLQHPLTPRPLRFSRNRSLRHWTIHRAFRLHQRRLHFSRMQSLEKQYQSMAHACEALRLIDRHGLTEQERVGLGEEQEREEAGRLFRIAMRKDGVWEGAPIEYARIQTETPPRGGWNGTWTR